MYQTKVRDKIGPLKTASGNITDEAGEMAKILNEFFVSVFTNERLVEIPLAHNIYNGDIDNILRKITISREEVLK